MVKQLVTSMRNYYASDSQISQRDKDLGDGLNRLGVYYSCLIALGVDVDDMDINTESGFRARLLINSRGLPYGRFRRGYEVGRWFHNPDNVTRDQMVTVEAAMALTKSVNVARAHFWLRAKRLFTHFSTQNDGADAGPLKHKLPDICTPSEFGTLIRATRYKWLKWLLPITDLFLYIDVAYSRSLNQRSLYDGDNQLLPQVLAAIDQPSIFTELIRRKYATTDAPKHLRLYYSEARYHDGGYRNGIEPLGELMVLAFERAIGGSDAFRN